jgi:hypothetical protein
LPYSTLSDASAQFTTAIFLSSDGIMLPMSPYSFSPHGKTWNPVSYEAEREHCLIGNFAQAETCGAKPAVAPAKQTVCGVKATMSIKRLGNPQKNHEIP